MRMIKLTRFLSALALLFVAAKAISPQTAQPHPLTLPFQCAHGDCPVLKGVPQTAGMRSGFVRLIPGETVGWHSTGLNEEALVILQGQGEALIDGKAKQPFVGRALVYIPPATRHNIANTGKEPLEYVWVVAQSRHR